MKIEERNTVVLRPGLAFQAFVPKAVTSSAAAWLTAVLSLGIALWSLATSWSRGTSPSLEQLVPRTARR